jgi:hypothetical protein
MDATNEQNAIQDAMDATDAIFPANDSNQPCSEERR